MNPYQYLQATKEVNSRLIEIIEKILNDNDEKIKEVYRDQLNAGLDGNGKQLTPSYSQDPYFSSPAAGKRYAAWKHARNKGTNTIFPIRNIDTPNLIVTGKLVHNVVLFSASNEMFRIDIESRIYNQLISKYGEQTFTLNSIAIAYLNETIVLPILKEEIAKIYAKWS